MIDMFRIIGGRASGIALRFFLSHSSTKIYAEKLLKSIKISKKSLLKALAELEDCGLIGSELQGRTKLYSLNRNDPVVMQLKRMLTMTEIVPQLRNLEGKAEIYIYGSAARGEDIEDSDLDILVVTKENRSTIMKGFGGLPQDKLNVVIMTQFEYAELSRKDKAFYERVEKDKVRVI